MQSGDSFYRTIRWALLCLSRGAERQPESEGIHSLQYSVYVKHSHTFPSKWHLLLRFTCFVETFRFTLISSSDVFSLVSDKLFLETTYTNTVTGRWQWKETGSTVLAARRNVVTWFSDRTWNFRFGFRNRLGCCFKAQLYFILQGAGLFSSGPVASLYKPPFYENNK